MQMYVWKELRTSVLKVQNTDFKNTTWKAILATRSPIEFISTRSYSLSEYNQNNEDLLNFYAAKYFQVHSSLQQRYNTIKHQTKKLTHIPNNIIDIIFIGEKTNKSFGHQLFAQNIKDYGVI